MQWEQVILVQTQRRVSLIVVDEVLAVIAAGDDPSTHERQTGEDAAQFVNLLS